MTSLYDAALAPAGITVAQFSLLRNIGRLAQPNLSTLASATGLERSTIGRNLRLLATAGLVRMDAARDRRARVVRLTSAGAEVIERALPRWQQVQDEVERRLGPDRRQALFELLEDAEHLAQTADCLPGAPEQSMQPTSR